MSSKHIYVSVDIEADGPIPGIYSMLSLGAAAFDIGLPSPDKYKPIDTFQINILPLLDARQDPATMRWWSERPEAYAVATKDAQFAGDAIPTFTAWLRQLPGHPICVAYPVGFDFTFIHYYNVIFDPKHEDPFGFSALDIKTLACAALDKPYPEAIKKNVPWAWFNPPDGKAPRHNHEALQDAIGQGILFVRLMDFVESLR